MDLDTKLTKYKYSNFNKFFCVILALLMLVQFVLNLIPTVGYVGLFRSKAFESREKTVYDYSVLWENINYDMIYIFNEANYNHDNEIISDFKKNALDEVVNQYLKESEEKGYTYKEALTSFGDFEDNYDYYLGDNGLIYFDQGFSYEIFREDLSIQINFETVDYGKDENSIRNIFEQQLASKLYRDYKYEDKTNHYSYVEAGKDIKLAEEIDIKNIRYYVEHNDGTVVTNSNKDQILSNIENSDFVVYENGDYKYSGNLKDIKFFAFSSDNIKNLNCAYFLIDSNFTESDKYSEYFNLYMITKDIDFKGSAIKTCIFALLTLFFLICSVRLAGRKNNSKETVELSFIDKLSNDVHLILSATAVGFAGWAFVALLINNLSLTYDSDREKWVIVGSISLAIVIYLIVLEYATSLARKIKSNENIFKNTFVYKFTVWFVNLLKKLYSKIKTSSKKISSKTKKYFETVSYMPKNLEKKAIVYSVLFVLANLIFAFLGAAFMFVTSSAAILMGVFIYIVLIVVDTYIIYKVAKYLKYLDMIITSSKTGKNIDADLFLLPKSLRTLAEGLEKTNEELENAIKKAVKDERTKTELITNVSHDLKTPLTSVINYIDLLKKCDIKDETAKQYMNVIDEKSIKLKRLIEDLIEASKVTTGNVTLNKTLINLYELAMQAVVEETSDIEKAGLSIIFEETSEQHIVFADGTKVYRVFENLLSNARKYSAPNSRIYAKVYSDDDYGYFEIKNISKDPLNITPEELTERFVRGDKSRNQDGNGLGLSIAKEICRLNCGELQIIIDGDLFKVIVKLPKRSS